MRRGLMMFLVLAAACDSGIAGESAQPIPAPGKADAVESGLPMISEYVEASFGHNKAIELFNPLPFAVAMDDCRLRMFFNGASVSTRSVGLEGLEMAPHGTLVACNKRATVFDSCDVEHGSLAFNGNDAVALQCDFGGGPVTLDVIGVVGENPGSQGWPVDSASTKNQTLRRRCEVATGHDTFEPEQWDAVGTDAFDGLGEHELCDPQPAACSQGEGVLGGPADAIFEGEDPRFEVLMEEVLFDNFTPRTQALLLDAASRFLLEADQLTDAASALAGVAREGSGRVESFTIRDTESGLDFDAVRYFANDATSHSVVYRTGTDDRVAFSFDGEFFLCDPIFCDDGDLSRPFYEGLDENFEPTDQYEILEHAIVLSDFERRARVLRGDDDPTLLTVAFAEHVGPEVTSTEALEEIARDNAGPITYYFVAGPTEDLEGVVFHLGEAPDHGLLVVEDSLDVELLTQGGEVTFCAPPPG